MKTQETVTIMTCFIVREYLPSCFPQRLNVPFVLVHHNRAELTALHYINEPSVRLLSSENTMRRRNCQVKGLRSKSNNCFVRISL